MNKSNLKTIHIIYLIKVMLIAFLTNAQNETAYVKQTQFGYNLNSLVAHSENLIFTKFSITNEGVELYTENKYTLIKFDEIVKVNTGNNSYRLEMNIKDMDITLFFAPYLHKSDKPIMLFAIILVSGLNTEQQDAITIFKLVFLDELKI